MGLKSGQLIFTVWPLENRVLVNLHIMVLWSLLLRDSSGKFGSASFRSVNLIIAQAIVNIKSGMKSSKR